MIDHKEQADITISRENGQHAKIPAINLYIGMKLACIWSHLVYYFVFTTSASFIYASLPRHIFTTVHAQLSNLCYTISSWVVI